MIDIKQFKLDYLYKKALISDRQKQRIDLFLDDDGIDLEAYKTLKRVEDSIIDFVKGGGNLYIHSTTTGNGKTSWAIRMVQSYFENIWSKTELKCRALFISVPRYMLAIKDNISEKSDYVDYIKKNVLNADIVIWDEVGTKGLTEFEHENIMSLINARIDAGKTNIYTSNLNDDQLLKSVGKRLHSRISKTSYSVELKGQDRRGFKS
jgi:DNA replication protein DnaC